MGKTKRTYRDMVQDCRDTWSRMERYLRRQHTPAYEQLWTHAIDHSDAAGEANPRDPFLGVLMSICLGQQLEIAELQERLDELEAQLDGEEATQD
ncbi:hypothetical protein ACKVMT_14100 [Halobacteriales archaeon Cl-PHB]